MLVDYFFGKNTRPIIPFVVFIFFLPLFTLEFLGVTTIGIKSSFVAFFAASMLGYTGIAVFLKKNNFFGQVTVRFAHLTLLSLVVIAGVSLAINRDFFAAGSILLSGDSLLLLGAGIFLYFFSAAMLTNEVRVQKFIHAVVCSALGVYAFFFIDTFIFSIFQPGVTVVGQWLSLPIFAGFVSVLIVLAPHSFSGHWLQTALYLSALLGSLTTLVIAGHMAVWLLLLFICFIFVATSLVKVHRGSTKEHQPLQLTAAIVLLCILLILVLLPKDAVSFLPSVTEIRPNAEVTMGTIGNLFEANDKLTTLFGSGPGTFDSVWAGFKPLQTIGTDISNIDFDFGYSTFLTHVATLGLLGTTAWILFFGSILYSGYVLLRSKHFAENRFVVPVFAVSVYLWLWFFVYVPGPVLLTYAFVFSGILFSSFTQLRHPDTINTSVQKLHRGSRLLRSGYALATVLILSGATYMVSTQTASLYYFERGIAHINEGNIEVALSAINKASELSKQPLYFDTYARVRVSMAEELYGSAQGQFDIEQNLLYGDLTDEAVGNAKSAVELDPRNYRYWITLGDAYALLAPFNSQEEAFNYVGLAEESYFEATKLNAYDPTPYFLIARLLGPGEVAEQRIDKALTLDPNYVPALQLRELFRDLETP